MAELKINTINIFIFFVILCITICILTFYDAVNPSYTMQKFNWAPFPTVKPENVPDADVSKTATCSNQLTKPNEQFGCSMCGGDDFVSTTVSTYEKIMFNGKIVPSGTWCLPKGKDNAGCGQYTGRATWSFNTMTGKQEWTCECLYPSLYGGKECLTQYVCVDPLIPEDQTNNKLVDPEGKIWDPLSKDFDPQNNSNPYEKNKDGGAKYTCQCNQNKGTFGTQFTRLPGEPYRCFADPCDPNHKIAEFDETLQRCVCPAEHDEDKTSFAHSNVNGKCYSIKNDCVVGEWLKSTNACQCPSEDGSGWVSHTCKNPNFTRDAYTDGDKTCDGLAAGSYCAQPCNPNPCENGASCIVVGESYQCTCPGTVGNQYCSQTCTDFPGEIQYSGQNCEKSCLRNGTEVPPYTDESTCCSGYINHDYSADVKSRDKCADPPPPCTIL
jgi:hypothetical protein